MKIANIYPVANQELYKHEQFVMILAHLVKKDLYRAENFTEDQYIIMDNGLFEGEQVSTDVRDCIDLAIRSGIPVDEIIVPDAVNDAYQTIKLFEENKAAVIEFNEMYTFMVVAQAKDYEELEMMIDYFNNYAGRLNLCVGISKLATWDRGSDEAIRIYKKCKLPIHFLGIKKTFTELNDEVIKLIRSCDTSQLAFISKNRNLEELGGSVWHYIREGKDIDLEHDQLDTAHLARIKEIFKEEKGVSELL